MTAQFEWTKSSPIKFKNLDAAKAVVAGSLNGLVTPGPLVNVEYWNEHEIILTNYDTGFLFDESNSDFLDDEISAWNNYMEYVFLTRDWRSAVRDGSAIYIDHDTLIRAGLLSIELGLMDTPLISCDGADEICRFVACGDTDNGSPQFFFDINKLPPLTFSGERYCIQIVETPSNDSDRCKLFVLFFDGSIVLKSYKFDFSGTVFQDLLPEIEGLFSNLAEPEVLLDEFLNKKCVNIFESFVLKILEKAQREVNGVAALGWLMAISQHEAAASLIDACSLDWAREDLFSGAEIAEKLQVTQPLAATIIYRNLIENILASGVRRDFQYAAEYTHILEGISRRDDLAIDTFVGIACHDKYLDDLKAKHGRKLSFWRIVEAARNSATQ